MELLTESELRTQPDLMLFLCVKLSRQAVVMSRLCLR